MTIPFVGSSADATSATDETKFSYVAGNTRNLASLKKVTVTGGKMFAEAFKGWSKIESITLPSGLTNIPHSAFYGCSSLKNISIPSGVTSIGYYAFRGCSFLKSVNIPSGVKAISERLFDGCSSLESVNIPSGVNEIMESTFEGCSSLENIQIPDNSSITEIGNSAFCGCSSLKTIKLPSGVKAIFNYAFKDCESLKSITVPSSIGVSAFEGCSSLYIVSITDKEYEYKGYPYPKYFELQTYENGSWSYYQGADHGIIGTKAFKDCSRLTSLTIPKTVDEICPYAFDGTSLTSVIVNRDLYLVNDNYYTMVIDVYAYYMWGGSGTDSFEAEQRRKNANALAKDYVDKRFASSDLTK